MRIAQARPVQSPDEAIAAAYNQAGDRYASYADGDGRALYDFDGHYAFGDRVTWYAIDRQLRALLGRGAKTLNILDLGCGPGIWLRRTVTRACQIGFSEVRGHGFDISTEQIVRARATAAELSRRHDVVLRFEVADICEPIPEADASADLCLCLYGVFNHVPAARQPAVMAEIRRITRGAFIATVRTIGSTPTIYVDSLSAADAFVQDNEQDKMYVTLSDGHRISFESHLFASAELLSLASRHFIIEDLRGLDLFHGRFAEDKRFNPPSAEPSAGLLRELDQLEARYCHDPKFIDHATHLMLVAQSKGTP